MGFKTKIIDARVGGNFARSLSAVMLFGVVGCGPSLISLDEEQRRMRAAFEQLRVSQADMAADLSAARSELREANGRIEALERGSRVAPVAVPRADALWSNSEQMIGSSALPGSTDRIVPVPGDGAVGSATQVSPALPGSSMVGAVGVGAVGVGSDSGAISLPKIVPAKALEEDRKWVNQQSADSSSGLAMFGRGLNALSKGDYRQAAPLLENASQGAPAADWGAASRFWLGMTYELLGDDTKALRAYHQVVTGAPKHRRAPLALQRQAEVFLKLNDRSTALLSLKKLVNDFPKSKEAEAAQQRIKQLEAKR